MKYIILSFIILIIISIVIYFTTIKKKKITKKIPEKIQAIKKEIISEVIPDWAYQDPVSIFYYQYIPIKSLNKNENYSMGTLLYESVKDNERLVDEITQVHSWYDNVLLTYCCINENGILKWEIILNQKDFKGEKRNLRDIFPRHIQDNFLEADKISYELTDKENPVSNYFYINLPKDRNHSDIIKVFSGNTEIQKIGKSLTMEYNELMSDYKKYLFEIGINIDIKNLLTLYNNVKYLTIINKESKKIVIIYQGLDINQFIKFLERFNYPDLIKNNYKKYSQLNFDVKIIYNPENQNPISTGFYGTF